MATAQDLRADAPPDRGARAPGLLAAGGLLGAALAASCCIVPLALVLLGVSGAWIGNLTALAPHQPAFIIASVGFLAAGFWRVYRRPRAACADGAYCARPASSRATKGALWVAALLVTASLAVNVIVPLIA